MKKPLAAASFALAALFAPPAGATVDAILDYTIVYEHPQSGDLCYRSLPMQAELGIPPASVMQAVFAPTRVFNQNGLPAPYVDINVVTKAGAGPIATYVSDAIDSAGVVSYEMRVDVTPVAQRNGTTPVGRARTIANAKVALLSMARSLHELSNGRYKLRVTFAGLPSQQGLAGTPLNATTAFPYGAGSPLLAKYEAELIDVGGSCR
jgi:hypothetical protein